MAEENVENSGQNKNQEQEGQIERARRIREQIKKLKSGQVDDRSPKSIREQVEDRARKSGG